MFEDKKEELIPRGANCETEGMEMSHTTHIINLGGVNCYLLEGSNGFLLIDAGFSRRRSELMAALDRAGCTPGTLKLVVITHGDFDHAGNAAFLKARFGVPIGMHSSDSGMVELGSMSVNRKTRPDSMSTFLKIMTLVMRAAARQKTFETFTPDLALHDGDDLSMYGFDARVVHLPGHSKGSIGVLTGDDELFCGDLLYNLPGFRFIDDAVDHAASVKKVQGFNPRVVYPGHGRAMSRGWGASVPAKGVHRES
jgi:hydroxyacylglutathione hydrolase